MGEENMRTSMQLGLALFLSGLIISALGHALDDRVVIRGEDARPLLAETRPPAAPTFGSGTSGTIVITTTAGGGGEGGSLTPATCGLSSSTTTCTTSPNGVVITYPRQPDVLH